MISGLVLVRHGKAQGRLDGSDDAQRKLTFVGKRALRAWYPRMLKSLRDEKDIKVWSSPAIRAIQTSEILCESLGTDMIEVHECLYEADPSSIEEELSGAEGMVVLVGHEPFMGEFCAKLCGRSLEFEKGAAACLRPCEGSWDSARLEWFVQGPDHMAFKTLTQLEEAFLQAAVRIESAFQALISHPDDVEALHQYRISIRVARSLAGFLSSQLKRKYLGGLDQTLKSLQDPTSAVREMDMLLPVLEQGSSVSMLCTCRRYEVRSAFIARLGRRRTARLLKSACESLRNPKWRSGVVLRGVQRAELERELKARSEEQQARLSELDYTDREAVHKVRKNAKAIRYAARELKAALPAGSGQLSFQMQDVQDRLGALCDLWVNEELVSRICGDEGKEVAGSLTEKADAIVDDLKASGQPAGLS